MADMICEDCFFLGLNEKKMKISSNLIYDENVKFVLMNGINSLHAYFVYKFTAIYHFNTIRPVTKMYHH